MFKSFILFIGFISFITSPLTFADSPPEEPCSTSVIDWVVAVSKISFKNKSPSTREWMTAATCKQDPDNNDISFIALAYDKGSEDDKGLLLAVLDTRRQKILSRFDGEIIEDAAMKVESDSLKISNIYSLSKRVRAFELDIMSGYLPNCGDGGINAEGTLYAIEGDKIRPVLGPLFMSTWQFIQRGNDRCTSGMPEETESIIDTVTLTLSTTKASTNGFRHILVTAKSELDNGQKSKKKPFRYVLKYDGKRYSTKKFDRSFDRWDR